MKGGLLIISIIIFIVYFVYRHYLKKIWGIDSKAKTPAVKNENGVDFCNSINSFRVLVVFLI